MGRSQMWILMVLVLASMEATFIDADAPIARQGCKDHCGNVSIPYPFGIGVGCFYNEWFEIKCNPSPTPKPYLAKLSKIEVMEVNIDYTDYTRYSSHSHSIIVGLPPLKVCATETPHQYNTSVDLRGSPFKFLGGYNLFTVEGCSGNAVLRDQDSKIVAGCGSVCKSSNVVVPIDGCYGVECCQTLLSSSSSLLFYHIDAYLQGGSGSGSGNSPDCLVASLIESHSANQYAGELSSLGAVAPVILSWRLPRTFQLDDHSQGFCEGYDDGIFCTCTNRNRFGSPYVLNGCQVPKACKHCHGYCAPFMDDTYTIIPNSYVCYGKSYSLATVLGLSISFGIVLIVIGLYGLYRFIKRRREIKRRANFFKRNGGLLLHQQLASNEGIVEGTKIFAIRELEKATDNFNENRILGQGGQGTVYKGMLVDGRIVAIKKAKLLDESQLEQFINEVVILSQINHRNVVKLFGCCLETEVPLLVYEFISNGTLFEHIHGPDEDFSINWERRLKIVLDSACAIAYLHSSSSIPIYHRDIKSSNILLDERYKAKVSDFGSSKTIAIDQTHLTTLVQGTMGYLDPEYFQSYQFTDKSDVYSFGVVLLELLTSKKPIYMDPSSTEQKNLVMEFFYLTEQSSLSNILDPAVVSEAKEEELMAVVELAKHCTNWSGKLRPTMKEVAMTLEMIIKSPDQVSTLFQQQEASGHTEKVVTEASHADFKTNTADVEYVKSDTM